MRRTFQRLSAVLAALALMAALGAVTATPAAAYSCASGKLCTFWDTFGWGAQYNYTRPAGTAPIKVMIGAPWTDNISSVRNNTNYTVKFWDLTNCQGAWPPSYSISPHAGLTDWGGTIWNDFAGCFEWMT